MAADGIFVTMTKHGPPSSLAPIEHSTMHQKVYDQIRDAFASGQVQPGQRIVIRELARALGTSMMPVREALHRLEAENALVVTNGRNLAVPSLSAGDYEELCLIRVALEGLAADEAAKHITPEELAVAADLVARLEDASDAKDLEGSLRYNREFHLAVYKGSHRPLLLKTIESLWLRVGPQLNYAIRHDIHGGDVVRSEYHPHRQVLSALRAGDGRAASLAIAYDISRAARIIVPRLQELETARENAEKAGTSSRKLVRLAVV
jgi:DNA-binding GntR family transcriptional regulator